jgi:hypothetical protein
MILRDELNQHISIPISSTEILSILQFIKMEKEREIEILKNKINRYEEKRRSEMVFYQSLSPVRKFFASRPASHHQAVEYMVQVKDRMKQINIIKQRIFELDNVIHHFSEATVKNELVLSSAIIEEINMHRSSEELKR